MSEPQPSSAPSATLAPIVFGEALVDAFADALLPGGAPFNVACHLAALGLRPLLITRMGDDEGGQQLRATAARCGLSLRGAQHDAHTARVDVQEHADGHVFSIPALQAFDRIDATAALAACAAIDGQGWLYFGTLALRETPSREALQALRADGVRRAFVDLNWRDAGPSPALIQQAVRGADVLKLSDAELIQMLGWLLLPPITRVPVAGEYQRSILLLCTQLEVRLLLVTHGADGAAAWNAEGFCTARARPPRRIRAVDTVGAGDAFSALMLAGLLRGRPLPAILNDAVSFASLSCTWRGALPTDMARYEPWRIALDAGAYVVDTLFDDIAPDQRANETRADSTRVNLAFAAYRLTE